MDINSEYEKRHLQDILKLSNQVQREYHALIDRIFQQAIGLKPKGDTFRITQYPSLETFINRELEAFAKNLEGILVNGIEGQWELSREKNIALVDKRYQGAIPKGLEPLLYDTNRNALESFINRKTGAKGLNLSQRVWNYTGQLRSELEQGLYTGISEGKSAKRMASEMKQYLKEPDKLFRRVRDAEGKLQLSKAAKAYKPGQGVYRSSYKNALRLTRTETNIAYRAADSDRWQKTSFVLAVQVKLSNSHNFFDICDHLQGTYPKDFKFTGWHPNCLCYAVPVLPSPEEYDKYEDAILNGTDDNYRFKGVVKDLPESTKEWLKENEEKIAGWASKPFFLVDNKKLISKVVK